MNKKESHPRNELRMHSLKLQIVQWLGNRDKNLIEISGCHTSKFHLHLKANVY